MAVEHYENFPVASVLLPHRLRPAVEAIYAFARSADDIADEGDADAQTRLVELQSYRNALDAIAAGTVPDRPIFINLGKAIHAFDLPLQPLYDLLSAFEQDVTVTHYADFLLLDDYCRRSANPVGRLMLSLYGRHDDKDLALSDAICTGLQLTNFWQDVSIDCEKGRVYLPLDDVHRFGVSIEQINAGTADRRWQALMAFEVQRARELLMHGRPLAHGLPGRLGWELRLVIQGGLRILEKIELARYDVFRHRPTLKKSDWLRIIWRAFGM